MTEKSPHALKRLALIDQYLAFTGKVQRSDLIRHFDIGVATASRSLKDYRDRYPENIEYTVSARCYTARPAFRPVFDHDINASLSLLAHGIQSSNVGGQCYGVPSPSPLTSALSLDLVTPVARAIVNQSPLTIYYASGSSGVGERVVVPHALFDFGGAWYFRAYNVRGDDFRNFRFSRVTRVVTTTGERYEQPALEDAEWNRELIITLGPHPQRANQEALREDLGLLDKPVVNLRVREALIGFVMNDLRVDCSAEGTLNPYEYHLRMLNRHDLVGVDAMVIAPGFKE